MSFVPIAPRTKGPPAGFELKMYLDGKIRAGLEQLQTWISQGYGLAAICGIANLVVIDFDRQDLFHRFWDASVGKFLLEHTLVVRTSRGMAVWMIDPTSELARLKTSVDARPTLEMEILIHHHLSQCPGNIHPSGYVYESAGAWTLHTLPGLIGQAVKRLQSLHCNVSAEEPVYYASGPISPGSLGLSEWQLTQLTSILVQLWFEHEHNKWIVRAGGFILRLGIDAKEAASFLSTLAGQLGCKTHKHTPQNVYREVLRLYDSASKGKKIPGLTKLMELANQHNRPDLAKQLLALHRDLKQDSEVRSSTQEWLGKKFGAKGV